MIIRLRGALSLAVLMATGAACGTGEVGAGSPETVPPSVTSSPVSTPAPSTAPAETEAAYKVPADPCRVLTAADRSKIGMKNGKKDKVVAACKWENEPGNAPPFRFRNLQVTYDAGFEGLPYGVDDAKAGFKRRMKSDYRQPSIFSGGPQVRVGIKQIGSSKVGKDFDEGYYVYFVFEVGGAKRSEGRAVLRKGNVIISIGGGGVDVPGRSVRDGKPVGNAAAQKMLDSVADRFIKAVR